MEPGVLLEPSTPVDLSTFRSGCLLLPLSHCCMSITSLDFKHFSVFIQFLPLLCFLCFPGVSCISFSLVFIACFHYGDQWKIFYSMKVTAQQAPGGNRRKRSFRAKKPCVHLFLNPRLQGNLTFSGPTPASARLSLISGAFLPSPHRWTCTNSTSWLWWGLRVATQTDTARSLPVVTVCATPETE